MSTEFERKKEALKVRNYIYIYIYIGVRMNMYISGSTDTPTHHQPH